MELLAIPDLRVIPDRRVELVQQVSRVTLDLRVELVRQALLAVRVKTAWTGPLAFLVIRDLAVVLDCRVYLDQLARACLDPVEQQEFRDRLVLTCAV